MLHHDALTRTLDKSNEIIGQYVQGEPAGFGGLFRLPRADGGGRARVKGQKGVWTVFRIFSGGLYEGCVFS